MGDNTGKQLRFMPGGIRMKEFRFAFADAEQCPLVAGPVPLLEQHSGACALIHSQIRIVIIFRAQREAGFGERLLETERCGVSSSAMTPLKSKRIARITGHSTRPRPEATSGGTLFVLPAWSILAPGPAVLLRVCALPSL